MQKGLFLLGLLIVVLSFAACKKQQAFSEIKQIESQDVLEETYPNRPIQLVVPYAPGGGTDGVARAFTQTANKYFDQPIVVVNKLGQGGARGLKEGLFAENDGYTVTLVTAEINTLSTFNLIDFSYKDMEPLMLLNTEPGILVASVDFPFDTVNELIDFCHETGKVFTIGSAGKGSIWNLVARGMEEEAKISFDYKYYDGTSIGVVEVLGGNTDLVIGSVSEVKTHIDNHQMKILTVFSDERIEEFPDIKTFRESGYKFGCCTWRGLAIPKGVDENIKKTLLGGFTKAAKDKDFIEMMEKLNLRYDYEDQGEFSKYIEENYRFYNEFKKKVDSIE